MIKRTDLLAKQPPIIPLNKAEEEYAVRLFYEGFTHIYKEKKLVYAVNIKTNRRRLIQGKSFTKLVKAIDLEKLYLEHIDKEE